MVKEGGCTGIEPGGKRVWQIEAVMSDLSFGFSNGNLSVSQSVLFAPKVQQADILMLSVPSTHFHPPPVLCVPSPIVTLAARSQTLKLTHPTPPALWLPTSRHLYQTR